jgi:hypothetical protein
VNGSACIVNVPGADSSDHFVEMRTLPASALVVP